MVLLLHSLALQSLPWIVVKRGMNPNGYREDSMYTVGNGVAKGNNGRKICGLNESKIEKSVPIEWPKSVLR